jgi:hypothetical protein
MTRGVRRSHVTFHHHFGQTAFMQDFEKLGVFYLGKKYDLEKKTPEEGLVLYDSKDLTTHGICVGMTGSGKTGLCLALLEEAALDGVPAIIIDPKGDLGNLLLAFPELQPADFKPWLDPADATRKGVTVDELAEKTATQWREGLASWGQDGARIRRYRDAVDISIYTPGGSSGIPLTVLRSFSAPPEAIRDDADAFRERVQAAVAGLLGLVGVEGDPLRSREHILLSNVLETAWRAGRDLDLGSLIREIQQPPFDKVGFVDLESFYPAKERFELSMQLNNLLASPGFQSWMQGESLDVARLLSTPEGKPRLSILSIAHLSDSERMFFVTLLLNEVIAWMRTQSGTSNLRALLYMDEVFGYFPPSANPPSKTPMLTLLKQARAFGVGLMLATQNPVDLDYKGLSNCGTWFLGRLQTERDKLRVLDGLEGASAAAGTKFDRSRMEKILSGLGNRVFLMNNVHDDEPVVFQSRWALSFLRGPLTREQIAALMKEKKKAAAAANPTSTASTASAGTSPAAAKSSHGRPVLPPDVPETFAARKLQLPGGGMLQYRPALLGSARIRYASTKDGIDYEQDVHLLRMLDDAESDGASLSANDVWQDAEPLPEGPPELKPQPEENARFASLPSSATQSKQYAAFVKSFKDSLGRDARLKLERCEAVELISKPGESHDDFLKRVRQQAESLCREEIEKESKKHAKELDGLAEKERKAQQKVEQQKSQVKQQWFATIISFFQTLVGIVLATLSRGGRVSATSINRGATAARSVARVSSEKTDVANAEKELAIIQEKRAACEAEFAAKSEQLRKQYEADALAVTEYLLSPKKTDVAVGRVTLCWTPWVVDANGLPAKGW